MFGLILFRAEEPRPRPTPPRRTPEAVARPISAIAQAGAASQKTGEDARAKAVDRLVEQLRKHPARPSAGVAQVGLYLIDAGGRRPRSSPTSRLPSSTSAARRRGRTTAVASSSTPRRGSRWGRPTSPARTSGRSSSTETAWRRTTWDRGTAPTSRRPTIGSSSCSITAASRAPRSACGCMQADGSGRRIPGRLRTAQMVAGEPPVPDRRLLHPRRGDDHGRPAGAQRRPEYPGPQGLLGPELGRRGDARGGRSAPVRSRRRSHRLDRRDRSRRRGR